jgi:membrane dipeptidase
MVRSGRGPRRRTSHRIDPAAPSRRPRPGRRRVPLFEYLEAGVDYREFALSTDGDRVEPFVVEVSAEEERTRRLDHVSISLHDHTEIGQQASPRTPDPRDADRDQLWRLRPLGADRRLRKLRRVATILEEQLEVDRRRPRLGLRQRLGSPGLRRAPSDADIDAAKTGRLAMISALEAGGPDRDELDRIDVLYGFGFG